MATQAITDERASAGLRGTTVNEITQRKSGGPLRWTEPEIVLVDERLPGSGEKAGSAETAVGDTECYPEAGMS